jgi:hypothetical protein
MAPARRSPMSRRRRAQLGSSTLLITWITPFDCITFAASALGRPGRNPQRPIGEAAPVGRQRCGRLGGPVGSCRQPPSAGRADVERAHIIWAIAASRSTLHSSGSPALRRPSNTAAGTRVFLHPFDRDCGIEAAQPSCRLLRAHVPEMDADTGLAARSLVARLPHLWHICLEHKAKRTHETARLRHYWPSLAWPQGCEGRPIQSARRPSR